MKTLKRTRAGRLEIATCYTQISKGDPARVRAQKEKSSSEARERMNARTSYQKLERKLAANFDDGDLYITLTYDDKHLPDCRGKAVRRLRSFLARLRKARKERGDLLLYVYVTEGCHPGGRYHHHLVVNTTGTDLDEIKRLWSYGSNVELRRLTFSQDYTYEDLAMYLTKEPREWGSPKVGERTWTPSLGLQDPEPQTESVPDYVTLTAPPGAVILACEGPIRNGYGEFMWIKWLMPKDSRQKRKRAKRKKPTKGKE